MKSTAPVAPRRRRSIEEEAAAMNTHVLDELREKFDSLFTGEVTLAIDDGRVRWTREEPKISEALVQKLGT